jgi:putative MATE family efflux protein
MPVAEAVREQMDMASAPASSPVNAPESHPGAGLSTRSRVLRMAAPVIGENLLQTLVGIVDTIFVAKLGSDALAGVGTSLQMVFLLISAVAAISIGSSILVAHAVGARATHEANRVARQAVFWSIVVSIPLSVLGAAFSYDMVAMFGLTPSVARIGGAYLQITLATSVVLMLQFALGSILRGAGDMKTPFFATLIANAINAFAAWVLIFGKLGMPALGSNGSAWAAALGRGIAVGVLVFALWQGRQGVRLFGASGWRPTWSIAQRILGLGVPAALEQLLTAGAFTALTILIARLGTDSLAAQRVAGNAMSFSLLPGFGFAIAATTLVGQSVGARRPEDAEAAAYEAMRWAMLWMGAIGICFFFGATWIMRAFSADPTVIDLGAGSLRAIAFVQPAWAVMLVLSGGLRGGGNTRFSLVVNTATLWAAVLLGWFLVVGLGYGLVASWLAFVFVSPLAAVAAALRFRKGDWKANALA